MKSLNTSCDYSLALLILPVPRKLHTSWPKNVKLAGTDCKMQLYCTIIPVRTLLRTAKAKALRRTCQSKSLPMKSPAENLPIKKPENLPIKSSAEIWLQLQFWGGKSGMHMVSYVQILGYYAGDMAMGSQMILRWCYCDELSSELVSPMH